VIGSISSHVHGPVAAGADATWILFPLPAVAKLYQLEELGSFNMVGSGKSLSKTWFGVAVARPAKIATPDGNDNKRILTVEV
jgi:hypothetical protein